MNEIVKFPINTPVEVALKSEWGERVDGRYGEQVRYSLTDDRIMYVPLYVEQRFRELAIGAGEPLLLCKQQVKNGDRNRTEWSVKRAPQQQQVWADETVEADAVAAECIPAPVEIGRNGSETPSEHQTAGNAKQEEQPSANSTAPMAQESALETNNQHQRQNTAPAHATDIVLASASSTRRGELTAKDSVFLPAMTMDVAIARRSAIVEFTRRIMVKDQDFGEIPGTHKPTLLKPGAEKLCNFFGLEPEFTPIVEEVDWTGSEHVGEVFCYARYRCRLLREGRVVGAGEGSCNSWEAKYRYRWVAEEQVPEHLDRTHLLKREVRRTLSEFDFAIERAETTGAYGKPAEHWQKFREAIRAGTARSVEKPTRRGNAVAWEIDLDSSLYRIPNPDVADVVNTIQKMAQKRALVAATLIATSASEFFTQDVEDADPSGRNIDTGAHSPGTREAQEHVRDRKLEELSPKPAGRAEADGVGKPWKNFGEMRRLFEQLREQVGETRYLEEMALAGVQNPGQFQSAGGGVMAALAVVPSPAVTAAPLYVIEDHLAALIETAELVSPEQELEFRAEFQTALTAAVEKRDRVGQFLAHLEQQVEFAKFEMDRLRQRKTTCERAIARLESYVIDTIEHLGKDSKGKYRTLEGKTTTFSLRGCPPSVEVTTESVIPAEYKTLTLKLPAVTWEQLLERLGIEERAAVLGQVRSPEVTVDKRSIKAAIDSGADIPGAGLVTGRHSLRRS